MSASVNLTLPPEALDALAERVADILEERGALPAASGSEDEWLRGADAIAAYLGCSRSRIYALTSARRLPVQKDGAALVARRSDLDRFIEQGGAASP